MRFFKYFFFFLSLTFSTFSNSAESCTFKLTLWDSNKTYSTLDGLCNEAKRLTVSTDLRCIVNGNRISGEISGGSTGDLGYKSCEQITCPSATKVGLKVPLNAQKYQCVNQCQYAIAGCVDIPEERGQTCTAISTGIDCGGAPPPVPPKDPNTQTPDAPGDTPAAPGQNTSNTNTNTATSTGTSTSTSTSTTTNNTTNNTSTTNTTTTTVNNTTTKIDLSSLESAIESIGKLLGGKLDAIKEALGGDSGSENGTPDGTDLTETNKKLDDIKNNGDKLNNWLQGKNEDGTGGGVGDNPFGTDVTPERTLDAQSFKTNIFQSNAQCPADKTLSMTLFTGRTFSRTLSFSMWCDKLAIFGSLILIAAYLYGASIIVRNS